jgi:YVTN family beta-propeller protein
MMMTLKRVNRFALSHRRPHAAGITAALVGLILAATASHHAMRPAFAQSATGFVGPTSSQPLALSADGNLLAAVNPDNNSVSIFDVSSDPTLLAETGVGQEPNGVAVLPDGSAAYVANTVSGTVSVVSLAAPYNVITEIPVGTEPYGIVVTPNGTKVYVANARSNDVSVIDPTSNSVSATIPNVGLEPRGLAITNSGGGDDSVETLLVTQFLARPRAVGVVDGEDNSKLGLVTSIAVGTDTIQRTIAVRDLPDTGFTANGDAIARIPPGDPQCADGCITGAYPNSLNNVGIRGTFAYIPSTADSPNGPVRFDVNTQSLLSALNLTTGLDANQTINMQVAVKNQTSPDKLFITQPWAIALKNGAAEGFVISAASNIVVKLALDDSSGAATVQLDPSDPTHVLQIPVGKNPRGIVVNSADTRAYVMNYISRDISVLDLTSSPETVIATAQSAGLPDPGSFDDVIHIGKELYNTSVGEFDPAPDGTPIRGRMSMKGWGACATCHPSGLSDNVVWIFASGPRRTIPQHTDFDQTDRITQRALNWSAIFDEEADFELNIRNVSGGLGLIVQDDGITPDPNVNAFDPPNTGRNQVTVRGVGAWDALQAYIQFGIRAPISPRSQSEPDVIAGRSLFQQNNCQNCHGGPQWTSSRVRFTPPPDPSLIVRTQLIDELRKVGTFDPTARNEVRATAAAPLGDDGFAPASLLSLFAFSQTFFHNGQADSLDAVLNNIPHRSAGTGVDLLTNPEDRRKLVQFLLSIDANTPSIQ